jgi:hypothetical protein
MLGLWSSLGGVGIFWYARLTIDNVTSLSPNHRHSYMPPPSTLTLDRLCSQSKSNQINPSTSDSLPKNTTTAAAAATNKGSAPPQGVAHKREIQKKD